MWFLTRTHCHHIAVPNVDALPPQCGPKGVHIRKRRARPTAVTIRYVKVAPSAPNWPGGCRGSCERRPLGRAGRIAVLTRTHCRRGAVVTRTHCRHNAVPNADTLSWRCGSECRNVAVAMRLITRAHCCTMWFLTRTQCHHNAARRRASPEAPGQASRR